MAAGDALTLPRWLTPEMLQKLNTLDAWYQLEGHTGHYEVRPHYQNGEPQFVDIDSQSVRINVKK
jgi:hypothetical protein